jgi:prepilin-type N-terminal cleavage/methylation domain-containing protein
MMCRSSKGFSLPEVLVAVAVFGIMGGALSSLLLLNMNWNRIAKEITTGTSVAQEKIEGLRAALVLPVANTVGESVTRDGITYTRRWTVSTGTNGLPAGVSEVAVTASWREPEPQSVTLRTYVAY